MEAPERILIGEDGGAGWRYGYWVLPRDDFADQPEYIRADLLEAHIGAVLEEAADAVYSVRCAPVSLEIADWAEERACVIRSLRPDAMQALERVLREARVEVLEQAAEAVDRIGPRVTGDAIRAMIESDMGKP